MLVSETHLKVNIPFFIQGYNSYRTDRTFGRGGGVAVIIKNSLHHSLLPILTLNCIETIGVIVHPINNNDPLHIFACYSPNSSSIAFRDDLAKLTNRNFQFIAGGDFNCRHQQWNCYRSNQGGRALANLSINSNNCFVIAPNNHTHYSPRGYPSTLDLFITNTPNIVQNVETLSELNSNHLPVILSISFNCSQNPFLKQVFKYKYANWNLFRTNIENKISEYPNINTLHTINEIDSAIDQFTKIIVESRDIAVPKSIARHPDKLVLDNDTIVLIRLRNTRRRQYQRHRIPYLKNLINRLNFIINQNILKLINEKWQSKLENLVKGSKSYWKTVKTVKHKFQPIPPLKNENNNSIAFTNEEKSFALARQFSNNTLTSPDPLHIQESINYISHNFDDAIDEISGNEIKGLLHYVKPLKSPGVDGIPYLLLKKLPDSAIQFISILFNSCLKVHYFPSAWKISKVIPILKPGKDPTTPKSYRPISLLPSLSKLFENLIKTRLQNFVDENNIMIAEQFGFRNGHSTIHQVHRIINMVKHERSTTASTGLVMIDLENAFNSVWLNGLLHKLKLLNIPLYLLKILKSYLSERFFFVQVMNHPSVLTVSNIGVPQGAVLSPLLFNLYINDIPKFNNCHLALFADDIAIYCSNILSQIIINTLNRYINILESFFSKWRLKINSDKCESIYFTRCRAAHKIPNSKINIANRTIEWLDNIRYLGITLDKRLTFKPHLDKCITKSNKLISTLYPLINKKSKLNLDNKLLIYKALVLTAILYGAPILSDIAQVHKNKLQIIQNKFLKIILKVPFFYRTVTVHEETKMNYISDLMIEYKDRYMRRLPHINNCLINAL